jgi:hypothetical protein
VSTIRVLSFVCKVKKILNVIIYSLYIEKKINLHSSAVEEFEMGPQLRLWKVQG